jgi:hypothetical protein
MRESSQKIITDIVKPKPEQTAWEWNRDNVDFSRVPAYDTHLHGPYDPEYMPYWKAVCETIRDPAIREVAICKCSRAGASENVILSDCRYGVAVDPKRTLYISGNQESVEEFFKERIKLGFQAAVATSVAYANAQVTEHKISFENMIMSIAWPKSKMAFKQSGWEVIYVDEFSVYPDLTPIMIRKRADTFQFSHIVWLSSPDPQQKRPSSKDPIFIEFNRGTQEYWFMLDPKTKKLFRFEMGGPTEKYGLKWDQKAKDKDGNWDLERVRKSAFYRTPDGTKILNKNKQRIIAKGKWVALNKKAPEGVRSFHLNAFYLPFESGDFGNIAVEFLKAKRAGKGQLKVFVMEYLAEPWRDDIETPQDNAITKTYGGYARGIKISESEKYKDIYIKKPAAVFVSVDVQKGYHWQVAREWIEGGDSGLIGFGSAVTFDEIDILVAETGAHQVYIDAGYERRRQEVFEYCYHRGGIPTIGNEKIKMDFKLNELDPFEGKSGAGKYSIGQLTFRTDIFKTRLLDLINSQGGRKPDKRWLTYDLVEREYSQQVTSEEKIEGAWEIVKGHPRNHLWDCEVIQLLAATCEGLYTIISPK